MPTVFATFAAQRAQFISDIIGFLGSSNIRLLWYPEPTDTTTSIDRSINARTITWLQSVGYRLSPLGLGHSVNFDITAIYGTTPDADNLSFGNGTTDTPFSILVLANAGATGALRTFVSKATEYRFRIEVNDTLTLTLLDNSAGASVSRDSTAAVTLGAWRVFGAVYDGREGATATAGARLYSNGVMLSSSTTSVGTYTAMENLTGSLVIGSDLSNHYYGDIAMVLIVATELPPTAMYWLSRLILQHHGVNV